MPTHNQNHHRYLDGEGDVTQTSRHASHDTLRAALSYPFASSRWQLPLVWRYARESLTRRRSTAWRVLLETGLLGFGHAGMWGLACALHGLGLGSLVYFFALGLPAVLGSYWMMLTNYLQHVGCDSTSEHDHSRNFVSPFFNWFVFENGLHSVHHQHPGLHWSRLRAAHRLSAARVSSRLNQPHIFRYFFDQYLRGAPRAVAAYVRGSRAAARRAA